MCFICSLNNPNDILAAIDTHSAAGAAPSALAFGEIWAGMGLVQETTDAAESTATTYTLQVGQSAAGTLSTGSDEDWYEIDLVAGVTYEFRLLGSGNDFLPDSYLSLFNSAGTYLFGNDDIFPNSGPHNWDSSFIYTATQTGTYYLEADAHTIINGETGGYLLSATEYDPDGPVFTVDEIAWQLINLGNAYFGSYEAVGFNVGADNTITVNLTALTVEGQALARAALDVWQAYTGITFQNVSGTAEITFDDADTGAYAIPISNPNYITSSTVNVGTDWLAYFGTDLESYSFETYIHEIGHALGLAHGGNYNGSAEYGIDNYYLNDSLAWSIMSYMQANNDEFDFGNVGDVNTYMDASFRYMYSPMIADMIAIQTLYGIPTSVFTGNTTWGFGANTGVAAIDGAVNSGGLMAMTVIDSGGIDTLNFSLTSANQVISLAAESLSSVLGGAHNLGIARGTVIENAMSGSGNDILYGNAVDNGLYGGAGNDTIEGNAGSDTLDGGDGNDRLIGGIGNDSYVISNTGDVIVEAADSGNDQLTTTANYTLGAGISIERLNVAGSTGLALTANELNNALYGNSGDDTLNGGLGDDTLNGGGGNDVVEGGIGNDAIDGGTGSDTLDGGTGNDTLTGASGNDSYYVNSASDVIIEVASGGNDQLFSTSNYTLAETVSIERLYVSGSTGRMLIANELDNSLYGGTGNDTLNGGAGNDVLDGGTGNDRLLGGLGNDRYYIDSSSDVILELADQGTDFVFTSVNFTVSGSASIERIYANSEDGLNLVGNNLDSSIYGGNGDDTLSGSGGRDMIFGGAGEDTLYGGTGIDNFVFTAQGDTDVIMDFSNDRLRFDASAFVGMEALGLGQISAAEFSNTVATQAHGQFIYSRSTGSLYFDPDGTGAQDSYLVALIDNNASLQSTWITLF